MDQVNALLFANASTLADMPGTATRYEKPGEHEAPLLPCTLHHLVISGKIYYGTGFPYHKHTLRVVLCTSASLLVIDVKTLVVLEKKDAYREASITTPKWHSMGE